VKSSWLFQQTIGIVILHPTSLRVSEFDLKQMVALHFVCVRRSFVVLSVQKGFLKIFVKNFENMKILFFQDLIFMFIHRPGLLVWLSVLLGQLDDVYIQ
jgi:hypothetical protein